MAWGHFCPQFYLINSWSARQSPEPHLTDKPGRQKCHWGLWVVFNCACPPPEGAVKTRTNTTNLGCTSKPQVFCDVIQNRSFFAWNVTPNWAVELEGRDQSNNNIQKSSPLWICHGKKLYRRQELLLFTLHILKKWGKRFILEARLQRKL